MANKNSMVRLTFNEFNHMVLHNKINNVFNKLGNIMSKQEIIEQLKNIKDQFLNDSQNELSADDLIEAITDIIHDTEGNDGLDFTNEYDDEYHDSFENIDFTALEV